MKLRILIKAFLLLLILGLSSCLKQRVELDETQWGDNAHITSVVLFKYVEVTNQLGYDKPVTGYQNVAVPTPTNIVDKEKFTVTLQAEKGADLKNIGIRFSHFAKLIEPINGAPIAGVISDFSNGPFQYRLTSADGTIRDWTVHVSVMP
ncbi:hypothetical protein ORI89_00465 [Sphingobacterium sp. UT-1RO-CII-1]|uniref:DUF5018-related domain-containing protein n=1 Tax=Sphingobacterium sp. UT-1RO-CII-1 TaxID=2995225 RepID=UPI00227D5A46|nr:hypothetical protein [Sphingobacterium sp. UT-1RO-CII-1]MCY4778104.1 hypothetical protein [Sphingobacterium sp. UT-1RO-CII-1]